MSKAKVSISENYKLNQVMINYDLIKESFAALATYGDEFSTLFYKNLFSDFPQIEAFFININMEQQKQKLFDTLSLAVKNCNNPDILEPILSKLGVKHFSYGVVSQDYEYVGITLLKTLKFFFNENWTAEAEESWRLFYQYIADSMINSSQELKVDYKNKRIKKTSLHTIEENTLENYIKFHAKKLFEQALNSELEEEFSYLAEQKARQLLRRAISQEVKKQNTKLQKRQGNMFSQDTKVLVVDDMLTMRKLVSKSLKTMGFSNIVEAADGQIAWNLLNDTEQNIQLVVSDWNMPNCTGLDLLKRVRADSRFKSMPFILLTAETEESQVKEAIMAGVDNYITKPFSADTLKAKLEAVYKKELLNLMYV